MSSQVAQHENIISIYDKIKADDDFVISASLNPPANEKVFIWVHGTGKDASAILSLEDAEIFANHVLTLIENKRGENNV